MGSLEAIRISCAGYPTRNEFLNRFGLLAPEVLEGNNFFAPRRSRISYDGKVACRMVLDKKGRKGHQLGKKRLFWRAYQMAELDARRAEVLRNVARTIQQQMRTCMPHKEFVSLRKAAIKLQPCLRGNMARNLYEQMSREAAALQIQKNFHLQGARTSFICLRSSAVTIQTGLRAMIARNEFRFRKQIKAAIIIQAQWRSYKTHTYYKRLQKAILVTQCGWRCRVARRELRKLKMAARETGALKAAEDQLEKRVEELTRHLQLEKRLRVDLEEAKAQEVAKWQEALQAMQLQVEEAKSLVVKEQEAARKAIAEAPPVIKETLVLVQHTEKLNSLTAEVERLKSLVVSEKQSAEEEKKGRAVALAENEERKEKLEDADKKVCPWGCIFGVVLLGDINKSFFIFPKKKKVCQVQVSAQRLEEKVSNLESENQVLRQQALAISLTGTLVTRPKMTIIQRTPENGNRPNGELKKAPSADSPVVQLLTKIKRKARRLARIIKAPVKSH